MSTYQDIERSIEKKGNIYRPIAKPTIFYLMEICLKILVYLSFADIERKIDCAGLEDFVDRLEGAYLDENASVGPRNAKY